MVNAKKQWPLLLLFSLGIFMLILAPHFLWLDRFPPGMYHDEIEYALSSKTYALKGTDLSGISFPLSLFKTQTLGQISAVPPIVLSPLWLFVPLSQTIARLPYTLLIILTAGIVGYLAQVLFKNKTVALLSSVLFLINPWSFFLARFAVDATFALFFFVCGITLIITLRGWKLLFPFLLFILGFFSYNGAKLIFLPVIVCCVIYRVFNFKNDGQSKREAGIVIGAACLFFLVFYFISSHIPNSIISSRSGEIIFLDKETLSNAVNSLRMQSIHIPGSELFINKATVSLQMFLEKYFLAFSPAIYFSSGDPSSITGYYYHGLFYLFDLPLLAFGSLLIWQKYRRQALFLLAILCIAPFATASSEHGVSVINRSFLLLPIFILISAVGLSMVYWWLTKKINKQASFFFIAFVLLISFAHFLFLYFFQMPVYAQENFKTSERVLAKYLATGQSRNKKIVVITKEPRQAYLETTFYSPQNEQNSILKNNTSFLIGKYVMGNIVFTDSCQGKFLSDTEYIISPIDFPKCKPKVKIVHSIVNMKDNSVIYSIYQDEICKNTVLSTYRNDNKLSDYAIEQMDQTTFCKRWIFNNQ